MVIILMEVFMEMIFHLHPDIFLLVKDGKKDVEVRLNDEKRQKLKVGDKLVFLKRPDEVEKVEAVVEELKYFNNFFEVADYYTMERIHRPELTKDEYVNDMQRFYSEEEQNKYGVVCIKYKKVDDVDV